jgi:hypothetical protein
LLHKHLIFINGGSTPYISIINLVMYSFFLGGEDMLRPIFSVKSLKLVTPLVMAPHDRSSTIFSTKMCLDIFIFAKSNMSRRKYNILKKNSEKLTRDYFYLEEKTSFQLDTALVMAPYVRSTTFPTLFDIFGCKLLQSSIDFLIKPRLSQKKKQGAFYL